MIADSVPPVVAVAVGIAALVAGIVAFAAVVSAFNSLSRFLLRLATAPGVVVHEFAHAQACRLIGVPVAEVVYFSFGDPPGYVRHARPERYRESFVVSVAPFLVNTLVALAAFLGAAALAVSMGLWDGTASATALAADLQAAPSDRLAAAAGLAWFGLVVGMQAFPSTGDANALWDRSRSEWRGAPVVLLGVPVVLVIYLANLLSWLWADVLYALGLAAVAFYAVGFVGL